MSRTIRIIISFLFLNVFCNASAIAAIFGTDNRNDVGASNPFYQLGRSVAVGVLSSLRTNLNESSIKLDTSKADFLCSYERFFEQSSIPYACTGFLVSPQILITAGHCVYVKGDISNDSGERCTVYDWMFDYRSDVRPDWSSSPIVSSKNIYRCKKIIYAVMEESKPYRDFAVILLDRPVLDRQPLELASSQNLMNENISMLGHPLGLPLKATGDGRILKNDRNSESFLTNLDAFEGNSGSPIFNSNKKVVGILVGGTPSPSLYQKPGESCDSTNRCDEVGQNCAVNSDSATNINAGAYSEAQRIESILKYLSEQPSQR